MKIDWYRELYNSAELTQGDIIFDCKIPIPNLSVYDAIQNNYEESLEPIEVKSANLIILSQACDIENGKIDSIVLCPVWKLSDLMETNDYYKKKDGRESLRQGKEPSYHLLNEYSSENRIFDYSVVDFHQIYTLPKLYLVEIAKKLKSRLRVLPPYREHLSQAFARYFMRVGLPSDISKEDIKNYSDLKHAE